MRASLALLLSAAVALVGAGDARAGTYDVVACNHAPGGVNNSWTPADSFGSKLETRSDCAGPDSYAGLYVRDVSNVANTSSGSRAEMTFATPPGTLIREITYDRWLFKEDDDDWHPALVADGVAVDTCAIVFPAVRCHVGAEGGAPTRIPLDSRRSLSLSVECAAPSDSTCVNGALGNHAVAAVLYGATVTLSDATAPTISNTGGTLLTDTFAHATEPLTFTASDNAGIRSARIYVDGSVASSTTYGCDFTYTVPCQNRDQAQLSLDTRSLTDGPHRVQVAAVDPAGNETKSASRDVVVDNSAPRAPLDLSVDGGADWRSTNSFDVRWTNADDPGAPVAAARYQLCAIDGSGCQPPHVQTGDGVSRISGISVPSQGEWALRLWLEDAAGNTDADQPAEISLRYGIPPSDTAPTPAAPATPAPADRDSAPALDTPISAPSIDPTPTTQPSTTTTRLDPRLRLSRPKPSGRRLLIRGVLARSARGRVSLTIRPQHGRLIRRSVTIRSGRFSLAIPRATLRSVVVRYAGNSAFRPGRATLSLSR